MPASAPESVARPASLVAGATMCSRILGLVREAVFAALFATSRFADAFVFAFRIPNLLRDFFAEGALAAAFVPTFTEVREKEGEARAFALARRVFGTLALATTLIVILGIVFAPLLVSLVAMDAPAELRPLTTRLTRIMFPFLAFVAMAAIAMGILNSYRRYFLPALAPMFFNVVAVIGGGVLLALGHGMDVAVTVWAALVVVGGALQLLVQLPALRKVGLRGAPTVDLRLRDPALRQIVRRMGPVVLSLAATNVMLVITTILASRGDGWASTLNYAFRLVHLPIGLIGVALGTVLLAAGARRSAVQDAAGLDDIVRRGLRLNWFLALPAAVGLFVLATPIVSLLYEWGRFGADSRASVAEALRWYAGGIVFYAGVKAAAPRFLAAGDTRTPMVCSVAGIAVNCIVAFATIDGLGFRGLALAVAVGAATNYLALRLMARRRFGPGSAPSAAFFARVLLACAVLGGLAWGAEHLLLRHDVFVASRLAAAGAGLLLIAVLGGIYFLCCAALGIDEARSLGDAIRRRWRR